jgi:hypothetical protein
VCIHIAINSYGQERSPVLKFIQRRRIIATKIQPTEIQIDANVPHSNIVSLTAPNRRRRLGCAWSLKLICRIDLVKTKTPPAWGSSEQDFFYAQGAPGEGALANRTIGFAGADKVFRI